MEDFEFKNIRIGLNYGTAETEQRDVIYIETLDRYGGIVVLSAEEAEMISKELLKFVELFKK